MAEEFLYWYWDWGLFASGVSVFILGMAFGWVHANERTAKRAHDEAVRLATKDTYVDTYGP